MGRARVVITDFIDDDLRIERELLGEWADVEAVGGHHEADLVGRIDEADALMVYHELSLSAASINRLNRCKIIVRCGVGIDNVDGAAARARGIDFCNVPDYGTEEVADSAIGFLLTLTRGIHLLNSRLQRGQGPWLYTQTIPLRRLRGRTLGLVGFGRIGMATALRGKALGMRVIFYDPYVPDGRDKAVGVERVETLAELMAQSFAVSLHCPLTDETRRMIHGDVLKMMPAGGYLVNTARGAVVDPDAVLAAITSGHLAGAGLDVLAVEPPTGDEPLLRAWRDPNHPAHDRVILNPHSAFYADEGLLDMRRKGCAAVLRALTGQRPRNVVN